MVLKDKTPKAPKDVKEASLSTEMPEPDIGGDDPDREVDTIGTDDVGSIKFDSEGLQYPAESVKGEPEEDESKLYRVECLQHDAIINGHKLAHGHVVEMNLHDVRKHRRHGVAISDPLPDDDKREVSVDVTKPFQPASTDEPAEPVDATG